jgi:hypothetical protein
MNDSIEHSSPPLPSKASPEEEKRGTKILGIVLLGFLGLLAAMIGLVAMTR